MTTKECLKIFKQSKYGKEIPEKIGMSDLGPVIITKTENGVNSCNHYVVKGTTVTPTYPPLCGLRENTIKNI